MLQGNVVVLTTVTVFSTGTVLVTTSVTVLVAVTTRVFGGGHFAEEGFGGGGLWL